MKKYIAHLRTKPESHKRKVALGTSVVITAFIALFWVTSFSYFNGGSTNPEIARKNTQNSPINVVRKNIASLYESLTGSRVEFVKDQDGDVSEPVLEYVPSSKSNQ